MGCLWVVEKLRHSNSPAAGRRPKLARRLCRSNDDGSTNAVVKGPARSSAGAVTRSTTELRVLSHSSRYPRLQHQVTISGSLIRNGPCKASFLFSHSTKPKQQAWFLTDRMQHYKWSKHPSSNRGWPPLTSTGCRTLHGWGCLPPHSIGPARAECSTRAKDEKSWAATKRPRAKITTAGTRGLPCKILNEYFGSSAMVKPQEIRVLGVDTLRGHSVGITLGRQFLRGAKGPTVREEFPIVMVKVSVLKWMYGRPNPADFRWKRRENEGRKAPYFWSKTLLHDYRIVLHVI